MFSSKMFMPRVAIFRSDRIEFNHMDGNEGNRRGWLFHQAIHFTHRLSRKIAFAATRADPRWHTLEDKMPPFAMAMNCHQLLVARQWRIAVFTEINFHIVTLLARTQ